MNVVLVLVFVGHCVCEISDNNEKFRTVFHGVRSENWSPKASPFEQTQLSNIQNEISSSSPGDESSPNTETTESFPTISSKNDLDTSSLPTELTEHSTANSFSSTEDFASSDETSLSSVSPEDENAYSSVSAELTSTTTEIDSDFMRAACTEIPEIVLNAYPGSFNVTLEWDPVPNCTIDGYIIYFNEEFDRTDNTSYVISELDACSQYTVGISGYAGTVTANAAYIPFSTTPPESFNDTVENFTIKQVEKTFQITWSPPESNIVKCITEYYLQWWDDNGKTQDFSFNATTTSHELSVIGCVNYTFQIKPKINNLDGSISTESYAAMAIPTEAPTFIQPITVIDKTKATVTWRTQSYTENRCKLSQIIVTCDALDENNADFSWVIRNREAVHNIPSDTPSFRFQMDINDLSPFTNYTCFGLVVNSGGNSTETKIQFSTLPAAPSAPEDLMIFDVGTHDFKVNWTEPTNITGIMKLYGLTIESGNLTPSPSECSLSNKTFNSDLLNKYYFFEKALPYHQYKVTVYAVVEQAENGTAIYAETITEEATPENANNTSINVISDNSKEKYSVNATVTFGPPCNINGKFKHYEISYTGTRESYPDHSNSTQITEWSPDTISVDVELQPERNYTFSVSVYNENFSSTVSLESITTAPGVPIWTGNNLSPPTTIDSETARFALPKSAFKNDNGEVHYYALILLPRGTTVNSTFGSWNGADFPELPADSAKFITEQFWNPFQSGNETIEFIIGDNNCCNNTPLTENTEYSLIVRALTKTTYKDSPLLNFKTDILDDVKLGLILGLTFGLLALLVLGIFIVILWRRKQNKTVIEEEEKRISTSCPQPIPSEKFIAYYETLKENYNILKSQYTTIGLQGKEVAGTTTFAVLPENRRKNRYTNILPYDRTRVTLNIDEDDEISSDYINASYIKGFSDKIEYIATQGPLESTTKDFWKMVLQENVSIIVMVSQFVEQTKEKCFQYFPNNHENVTFGDVEVRCSTELHFGTYCIRTLQVKKDTDQRNVMHMQFLEWPDFGVPQGTDNMLQFCRQLREKAVAEGGLIVVHCSAGVGRTGTLISLDILLQAIDNHRDINIYKTVYDLRKQRTNMVQTEKQYMFIHTCVRDYLEAPKSEIIEEKEVIYENIPARSLKEYLIGTELESAL